MNGLRVPWAQCILSFSLPLLSMGVMGSRPVISLTYTRLTMANYENLKWTDVLGNAPLKMNPPRFPWLWQGYASDHNSKNSSNHPPVPSTSSFTYFSNTNTNPYFYIYSFLQYNYLWTIYTTKKLNYSSTLHSGLYLFYNSDCFLLSRLPTPIHYH